MSLGGIEVINQERTARYIERLLPGVDVLCPFTGLHNALGHGEYISPAADGAPWYNANHPDTGKFYGLYPSAAEGAEDSSRTLTVTELASDGAIQSLPRHGSKEIRVRGRMYAADEAGMQAGIAWLRTVLDDQPCGEYEFNCEGRELNTFTVSPGAETEAEALDRVAQYARVHYRVEPLEGPRIASKLPSKRACIWEVEFILNCGIPWAFTFPEPIATTTGIVPTTAAEVYCPPQTDAYDALVVDPQQPAVERPPRPPQIEPVQMPADWSRYVMSIGDTWGERWGRLVPVINVTTGVDPLRRIRIRFYRENNNGQCDYEGEFYIRYLPANAQLTIDGVQKRLTVEVAGQEHPAGNLVIGSDGKPVHWPSLACRSAYDIIVDSDTALPSDVTVLTEIAVRE